MSCLHVDCLYDNSSDYTSASTQWVWLYMSHYHNMPTAIVIHPILSLSMLLISSNSYSHSLSESNSLRVIVLSRSLLINVTQCLSRYYNEL